ncbi:MAG TPA: DNA polymerase III subunit delta' [Symbiobacteriaceae bacterium]|nr:DNA polymerase III subunit delta' [Symbiobacteriaceae bacterium]
MQWTEVVGQPLAVRLLQRAVRTGKVAHAYLFAGPSGIGKRTIARLLAQVMLCQDPTPAGAPCGQCGPCRRTTAEPPMHPDLHMVEPDGRFIKTEQMKELQSKLWSRPQEGRRAVAIIDGADKLNPEAGNRLLKLLEEPPSYVILILLAENLSGVLPTILSRCQVLNFAPLPLDEMAQPLARLTGKSAAESRLLAALSGGSLGRALQLAQDEAVAARRSETYDLLLKLSELDDLALVSQAEVLEKAKGDLEDWLEIMTVWLRDALLLAQMGAVTLILNADRQTEVAELVRRSGTDQLLRMLTALGDFRAVHRRNVNLRLALDVLLLRLAAAAKGAPELALNLPTPL